MNNIKRSVELEDNIGNFKESYLYFLLVDKDSLNTFTRTLYSSFSNSIVIKNIQGINCNSKRNLFREFAIELDFPNYFGYNWDEFDECISDLSWLLGSRYIIVINDFDKILSHDSEGLRVKSMISYIDVMDF